LANLDHAAVRRPEQIASTQNAVSNRDNLLAKSRLADEAQTEPI
jgi:hypothetical protein